MNRSLIVILNLIFFLGCSNEYQFNEPELGTESQLKSAAPVEKKLSNLIEGIYTVQGGNSAIGDKVVIKFSKEYTTVFCGKNIDYFLLKSGLKDTNIIFEGFSRIAENVTSGSVKLKISKDMLNNLNAGLDSSLIISGSFNRPETNKEISLILKKISNLKTNNFYIAAHRGGGRNSDYLNISENSLEMLKFSEALGANAVEIDVRLTSDKVPILFHDSEFSTRTIQGDLLIGEVNNYTFKHIRSFGRLKYGEKIPTLDEALNTIVSETNHKLVWLDIKDGETLSFAVPLILKYQQLAATLSRDIKIAIGVPDNSIKNKFSALQQNNQLASICELSTDEVQNINADFWAPRWTNGAMTEEVNLMHSQKRKVITWTMDDRNFIKKYLAETNFDGILTNYPVIVAYEYWIK